MHCYVTCVFELHATFVWAPPSSSNFARNSPGTTSNRELTSLQLRRLWAVSKSDRGKLCVSFAWLAPVTARRPRGKALRALRRPSHRRRCVADVWPGASTRCPARPCRPRGGLQSSGAWCVCACSGLAGALHTGGVCGSGVSVQAPRWPPGGASQEPWCSSAVSHAIPLERPACSY